MAQQEHRRPGLDPFQGGGKIRFTLAESPCLGIGDTDNCQAGFTAMNDDMFVFQHGQAQTAIGLHPALIVCVVLVVSRDRQDAIVRSRSEEHTSELQSLMRISYAVFCLYK